MPMTSMAAPVGLEPTTYGLTVRRSTYWTTGQYLAGIPGLKPRLAESKSAVLSITPYPNVLRFKFFSNLIYILYQNFYKKSNSFLFPEEESISYKNY